MRVDSIGKLLRCAKEHYRKHGRLYLPWRKTRDPYKIMVSEVMLQQTQVDRVIPFYNRFVKKFPSARSLAKAELSEVLRHWQGLGYNRRGKMLRDAARMIVEKFYGKFPKKIEDIELLPGIGPYTARAISSFAFNNPEVFVETNIRTVYFYYSSILQKTRISDADILPKVADTLKRSKMEPREFYAMLMDYGSFLKKSGIRVNSRSKHYIKQSKFEGSRRQLRGQILRLLIEKPRTISTITSRSGRKPAEVREELQKLQKEALISRRSNKFRISN